MAPDFQSFREKLKRAFRKLGYRIDFKLLNASDFGVPQLRPRVAIVGLKTELGVPFVWPEDKIAAPSVGEALIAQMRAHGWEGAEAWAKGAQTIAPTLVGGSKKHGGPDLGPTRARAAWAALGVDGKTVAEEPPAPGFEGMPRLTVQMAATIQGFPENWTFAGKKTPAYRQVGNAFPPPVAEALGTSIARALTMVNALAK